LVFQFFFLLKMQQQDYYSAGNNAQKLKQFELAYTFWLKAAHLGHIQSQIQIGICHHVGFAGAVYSSALALRWYQRADKQSGNERGTQLRALMFFAEKEAKLEKTLKKPLPLIDKLVVKKENQTVPVSTSIHWFFGSDFDFRVVGLVEFARTIWIGSKSENDLVLARKLIKFAASLGSAKSACLFTLMELDYFTTHGCYLLSKKSNTNPNDKKDKHEKNGKDKKDEKDEKDKKDGKDEKAGKDGKDGKDEKDKKETKEKEIIATANFLLANIEKILEEIETYPILQNEPIISKVFAPNKEAPEHPSQLYFVLGFAYVTGVYGNSICRIKSQLYYKKAISLGNTIALLHFKLLEQKKWIIELNPGLNFWSLANISFDSINFQKNPFWKTNSLLHCETTVPSVELSPGTSYGLKLYYYYFF
jgi:hypothetical protein